MSERQKFFLWLGRNLVGHICLTALAIVFIINIIGTTWALITFCVILALNLFIVIFMCLYGRKSKERDELK